MQLLNRHIDQYDYENGVALLEIMHTNLHGGQLQIDLASEAEANAAMAGSASSVLTAACVERRYGDPVRYGTATIEPCSWVVADLKRRPHVVLKGAPRDRSEPAWRHSLIVQNHEPCMAQLRRGEQCDKGFVSILTLQVMVMDGTLPFSAHEEKVMDDLDVWTRSRWNGVASQQELREAFLTHSAPSVVATTDGEAATTNVNTALADRRSKRMSRRERAFRPLTPTVAHAVPLVVTEAARLWLDEPTEGGAGSLHASLLAGVAQTEEPAVLAMLETLVRHANERLPAHGERMSEEIRCGYLSAALLGAGATDSLLLSFLSCKEASELQAELEQAEVDIKCAYTPCAWPGGELGSQQTAAWFAGSGAQLPASERCAAAVMRVFFCVRSWQVLVDTPALLATLVEGDDALMHSVLVALEAKKERIFKRRYQGTGVGPNVVAVLAKADWAALAAASASDDGSDGGDGVLRWSIVVQRLMSIAKSGVSDFLGTKLLLQLVLACEAPEMADDEAALGPGAEASLWSIYNLMRTGEFVPSYQMKPSEVQHHTFDAAVKVAETALVHAVRIASETPSTEVTANAAAAVRCVEAAKCAQNVSKGFRLLQRQQWLGSAGPLLRTAMVAYWAKRLSMNPRLAALDEAMRVHLHIDLCTIVVESFLCEVLRRRNVRNHVAACVLRRECI